MKFIVPADARSWAPVTPESHFPIQNLPFGILWQEDAGSEDEETYSGTPRTGVAIGDFMLDLGEVFACVDEGVLDYGVAPFPIHESLWLAAPGDNDWSDEDVSIAESIRGIRQIAFDLLRHDNGVLRDNPDARERCLIPLERLAPSLPILPAAFVDFYSGINHASNVGKMFRPDQPPLLPNYRHIPIGYNGRASTVVASDTPIVRPWGHVKPADGDPEFVPTRELDFELELGFFAGLDSPQGIPIPMDAADEYIAGLVLVNDWSARDVQRFEYQPLGPFLAKSFATSVSPWVVSLDALEPFRIEGMAQEPVPLSHLRRDGIQHFEIELEVWLKTEAMSRPQIICRSNSRYLYWSFCQQLVHQASNGTALRSGDLYASGTISGEEPGTYGSLLELTWRGTEPITLNETGETRTFLEDGDTLIMTAYGQADGYRIGFGEVRTTILPALSDPYA